MSVLKRYYNEELNDVDFEKSITKREIEKLYNNMIKINTWKLEDFEKYVFKITLHRRRNFKLRKFLEEN